MKLSGKHIRYRIEAAALWLLFTFFRLLPLDVSSAIGGEIGRLTGPFFSAHKTARRNIAAAFPEMKKPEIHRLMGRMWEHLGRVGAEYSSLPGDRLSSRILVSGAEYLPKPGEPGFLFSGHIGNWELLCPVAYDHGVDLSIVYRHTNNPYVDTIIANLRRPHTNELIAKGMRGGVKILGALRRGGSVAMLVDQKQNNGISIPFFGREAMTSPAIAEIALKYDIPIIPARIIRTQGAHFQCIVYTPIVMQKTGDHKEDVRRLMMRMHAILEEWIRECPEQWFWVHRRWPKEGL
ncbi:MAG: lauroyl acyltransferase [Alphaproteobacteria bacterium]|nr:lauroyl acyltransferase [Alphaproteobacteria bacterium]